MRQNIRDTRGEVVYRITYTHKHEHAFILHSTETIGDVVPREILVYFHEMVIAFTNGMCVCVCVCVCVMMMMM